LLAEASLAPRPDYWNSLLWRRLMGRQVYPVQGNGDEQVRAYLHAHPTGEGFTLLAINLDPRQARRIHLPQFSAYSRQKYILTAPNVLGGQVWLNGQVLALAADGSVPETPGMPIEPGADFVLPALSYGFLRLALP